MNPKGMSWSSLALAIFLITVLASILLSQVIQYAFERSTISANPASPFELDINQTAIIKYETDVIKIKFLDVLEDSRCLPNSKCSPVAGGNGVAILVNIQKNGENIGSFRLTTKPDDIGSALVTFDDDGHSVRLETLEPEPEAGKRIGAQDYAATLVVFTRPGKGERIYFETISRGAYSGHDEGANYVIRNQDDLDRLLAKAQLPPVRDVDFSKDIVIAVFSGTRPTGGHGIEITEMYEYANAFSVVVRKTSPGRGCIVTQAPSQPYHVIKIPLSDKDIVFKTIEASENC